MITKADMIAKHDAPAAPANPRPYTAKQQAVIDVVSAHPDLSTREAGKLADVDHSTVVRTLARYKIERQEVEEYKSHRADVLSGLQHRLLASCTDEDIKKAPLGSRVLAAAQLYDKERLERGQSTANVGIEARISLPDTVQEILDRVTMRGNGAEIEGGKEAPTIQVTEMTSDL